MILSRLTQIFDRRERARIVGLTAMLMVGSALEIFGIGLLLPFIEIVRRPAAILADERFGPFLRGIGLVDERSLVVSAGLAFLGVFLLKNIYVALQWRALHGWVYGKLADLSKRMLATYLGKPYTFHLQRNTAELIRNATIEIYNLMGGVVQPLMTLAAECVVSLGLVGLLLLAEPWAALAGLVLIGSVGFGFTRFVRRRLADLGNMRTEQEGRMIQWVNQSLGGVKEISVLGRQKYFTDQVHASGVLFATAMRDSVLLSKYPRLAVETALVVGLVGLVVALMAAGRNLSDALPVLALFAAAAVRLIPSFTQVVSSVNNIRFYLPSLDIVHHDLVAKSEPSSPAPLASSRIAVFREQIQIANLGFSYEKSKQAAIRDIDLTITRGQAVAFVGSSGAGKTTLANLILGLLEPTSGQILADGTDILRDLPGWQRQLGYIPQDVYLSDDTLRRNVAFGVFDEHIDDQSVWRALELAQLADFARGLPDGLDASVGERGIRISGGQRQRIGIARALYHDPQILVLDEATSSLDTETERELQNAVYGLLKTKTLIIIAHRLSTIRRCDVIYLLAEGRLAGSGTYDQLLAENSLFQQLVAAG